MPKLRLKKGDTVIVRSGKFKGRTAKIIATHPKRQTLTLEGLNVVTRHRKATQQNPGRTSYEITRPFPASKVALYDSGSKKPSRVGFKLAKDGGKTRIMKTSGKEIK
jgi:large subunit ribosomal protein L24